MRRLEGRKNSSRRKRLATFYSLASPHCSLCLMRNETAWDPRENPRAAPNCSTGRQRGDGRCSRHPYRTRAESATCHRARAIPLPKRETRRSPSCRRCKPLPLRSLERLLLRFASATQAQMSAVTQAVRLVQNDCKQPLPRGGGWASYCQRTTPIPDRAPAIRGDLPQALPGSSQHPAEDLA